MHTARRRYNYIHYNYIHFNYKRCSLCIIDVVQFRNLPAVACSFLSLALALQGSQNLDYLLPTPHRKQVSVSASN